MKQTKYVFITLVLSAALHGCDKGDSSHVATLDASPNPVTVATGSGRTTITWNASDNKEAAVYVQTEDGEKLFASGSSGSDDAPWIEAGKKYEFRLYSSSDKSKLLKHLTVTGQKP